jgi:hypothetical protein
MEQKSRLDEAIVGLKKLLDSNREFKNITIDRQAIHIRNSKPDLLGTVGYLLIIFIIPTGLLTWEYMRNEKHSLSLIISAVLLFLLGRDLYKIVRGEKVTLLDLKEKRLEVKNINGVFGKFIKKEEINFDEILKIKLVENAIYHKYSSTKWLELTLSKKNGGDVILASFNKKAPENFIAEKVKSLFEAIIWIENK